MPLARAARSILLFATPVVLGYRIGLLDSMSIDWSLGGLASLVLLGSEALISLWIGGPGRFSKTRTGCYGVLWIFSVMVTDPLLHFHGGLFFWGFILLLASMLIMSRLNTERCWCGVLGMGIFITSVTAIFVMNARADDRWGTGFSGIWMT